MKKTRIAINGLGRIGRAFLKRALEEESLDVICINDLGSPENLAYLLKYDTVYGIYEKSITLIPHGIQIGEKKIAIVSEKDPMNIPWGDMEIDVVVESTGIFDTYEKAGVHIRAGAKRVVITAPVKDEPTAGVSGATVLMGVNEETLKVCTISSNASCTTNAGSPLIAILDEGIGIEKAILNTAHAMTNSQPTVDGTHKHNMREGRAASQNIIPTSTGAAIAVTKAFTKLKGLFDGISMRVPVIAGSMVDVTFIAKKPTTVEEVNTLLTTASESDRWKKVFAVTNEPLVSSDILGMRFASIADLDLTRVVGGNLVKVCAWYDNEVGYTEALVLHVLKIGDYV